MLVLVASPSLTFLPSLFRHAAFATTYSLFTLYSAQLALGDKPALAANSAQYTASGHFFAETLHQLLLRFILSKFNSYCQVFSHPFFIVFKQKGRGQYLLTLSKFVAEINMK